jgi:WD40 repeat protein
MPWSGRALALAPQTPQQQVHSQVGAGTTAAVQPASPGTHAPAEQHGEPLPEGAVARLGTTRFRGGFIIYQAGYSPDGRSIAAATAGEGVVVWDADTGKRLGHFLEKRHVYAVAFSPDGRILACPQRQIEFYDTVTGNKLRTLAGHDGGMTMCLAFSPDGKLLASGGHDNLVRVWEVATGREIHKLAGHTSAVRGVFFASDDRTLFSYGVDESVRYWDVSQGRQQGCLDGMPANLRSLAVAANGQVLASGHEDGTIQLWSTTSRKKLVVLASGGSSVTVLALARDGSLLASGHVDGSIAVWQRATGKRLAHLRAGSFRVAALAFAPRGDVLASASIWDCGIRLWQATSGKELPIPPGHHGLIDLLAFSSDGKSLFSGSRDKVLLRWDLAGGISQSVLSWQNQGMERMVLSPDQKKLASWQWWFGEVRIWNLDQPTKPQLLGKYEGRLRNGPVVPLAFASDSKRLAGFCMDHGLRLWDVQRGVLIWEKYFPNQDRMPVAFAPDGKALATGGEANGRPTLQLWDAATGRELRSFKNNGDVATLAFSPDGKVLATANYEGPQAEALLWDVATGKFMRRLAGLPRGAFCLAFSADGWLLAAAAGEYEEQVHVLEVATGQEVRRFSGLPLGSLVLAFAPDGRALAGGDSSTVVVWDLPGRQKPQPQTSVAFTPAELDQHWAELAGGEAPRAFQAIWDLAEASHGAMPFLQKKLRPAQPVDENRIQRLIGDLDAPRFALRRQATAALEQIADAAEPALRKRLEQQPSLEVRQRIEQILAKLDVASSPERLRQLRALQALEYAGTPEARQLLRTLTGGEPGAWLTREAKAVLARLGRRGS